MVGHLNHRDRMREIELREKIRHGWNVQFFHYVHDYLQEVQRPPPQPLIPERS